MNNPQTQSIYPGERQMNKISRPALCLAVAYVSVACVLLAPFSAIADDENKTGASESEHGLIVTQLGWGYDINGRYCHEDAFMRPIFEVSDDADRQKEFYRFNRSLGFDGTTKSGKSASEFAQQLAVSAGISYEGGAYAGELQAEYGFDTRTKKDRSFVMDQRSITRFRVRLKPNVKVIPKVQRDIDNAPAMEVIKKYGAYYARDLYYGGNLTFRSSAENTEKSKNDSINVKVVASGWGVSGNAGVSGEMNSLETELSSNMRLKAQGGDAGVLTQSNFSDDRYQEWQSTIKSGNIALAKFGSQSLAPIWDLASTPKRKGELKAAAVKLNPKMVIAKTKPKALPEPIRLVSRIHLEHHFHVPVFVSGVKGKYPIHGNSKAEIHLYHKWAQDATTPNNNRQYELRNGSPIRLAMVNQGTGNNVWFTIQSGKDMYLSDNGSQPKAQWKIWKGNSKHTGLILDTNLVIRDGDWIALENAAYNKRYLRHDNDEYFDIQNEGEYGFFKIHLMK